MSAPKVIAQAVNTFLTSFPGFRLPTRMRLIADIGGGNGTATIRTTSTPGVAITGGTSGVYDITFDAGRDMSDIDIQVRANAPSTAAQRSLAVVDASSTNTNGTTGKLRIVTGISTNGTPTALFDGDILEINWTMDYG